MPADPLAEALVLLTAWLDGDETCATLQRARAWVDARRAEQAAPTYQRFVGVDHGSPGGSYEVVMERRPDGWSLIRGALQPPTDPPPSADYPPTDPPPSADYVAEAKARGWRRIVDDWYIADWFTADGVPCVWVITHGSDKGLWRSWGDIRAFHSEEAALAVALQKYTDLPPSTEVPRG